MKTFFRVSMLGLLLCAVVVISNQTAYAQDPKTDLYNRVVSNYDGDLAQRKLAVKAGKEYLQKYGNDPENQAVIDWLKQALPDIEKGIKEEEKAIAEENRRKKLAAERKVRFDKFNAAHKSKNWDALFAAGGEILAKDKEFEVDVAIELAAVGYNAAFYDRNDKFASQASDHAVKAIRAIQSGKGSKTKNWGVFTIYKTKAYPDGKTNALGWMNYIAGWTKYYSLGKKDDAIPYFYRATQYKSYPQKFDVTYSTVGAWYVSKLSKMLGERNELVKERNAAAEMDEPDEEKVKEYDARLDAMIALEKGYADRAIDAYSRAYGAVPAKDKTAEFAKKLFTRLQELYKLRYEEQPEMQTDAAINMKVASIGTLTMPDPSSKVQPVNAKPVETTTEGDADSKAGASRSRTVSSNN